MGLRFLTPLKSSTSEICEYEFNSFREMVCRLDLELGSPRVGIERVSLSGRE